MAKEDKLIDNAYKNLEKIEKLLTDHLEGVSELSESRLNKVLPNQLNAVQKTIDKIEEAVAEADELADELERIEEMLETAQSGGDPELKAEVSEVISSDDLEYLGIIQSVWAENRSSLHAGSVINSGYAAQSSVDNLIRLFSNWPTMQGDAEDIFDNYADELSDPRSLKLINRQPGGIEALELHKALQSEIGPKIDGFLNDAAAQIEAASGQLAEQMERATQDETRESYFNYYGSVDAPAEKLMRGMRNVARLAAALSGDDGLLGDVEGIEADYQDAKNAKAESVVESNSNAADVYQGADKQAIIDYASGEFARQSSYPLIQVNVVLDAWKAYKELKFANGKWTKVEYMVTHVNVLSDQGGDRAAEHQGFLYKSMDGQMTAYEVALYADGVPASNQLLKDNIQ